MVNKKSEWTTAIARLKSLMVMYLNISIKVLEISKR